MVKNTVKVLIILLFLQANLFAQTKISNVDFSYRYKSTEGITGKILGSRADSVANLLVRIDKSIDSLRKYQLTYSLSNSLEEDISTSYKLAPISSYFQYEDKSSSYFGLKIKVQDKRYVILWLADTAKHIKYPLIKDIKSDRSLSEVAMHKLSFNAPIINNYLRVESKVRLRALDGTERNLLVKFYDHNFKPALPPMTRAGETDSISFSADERFNVSTNDSIDLDRLGLYYFEMNGADLGQSVITTHEQYPGTNTFDELVKNLRYLATEEEFTKMSTSFEKKELFDKFWLNNTKSEEKAKEAIREYYKRVRQANQLFTSYKEGWKTDRGMIYIVFGSPNRVFTKNDSEMWIYEKSFELPRVSFTFSRIETAFTDEHYVLMRNAEYQNLWFRVVDLWRKGKKEY